MLTVTAEELAGSGTVTSTPAAISCGTDCGARFDRNATVTLTAAPGSERVQWLVGWRLQRHRTMHRDDELRSGRNRDVRATTDTLSVSPAGGGSGSVAGTAIELPRHLLGRATGTGTLVTLIATPNGFGFSGWSGGGCSGTGPCAVTMSSDQAVTAMFVPTTQYP